MLCSALGRITPTSFQHTQLPEHRALQEAAQSKPSAKQAVDHPEYYGRGFQKSRQHGATNLAGQPVQPLRAGDAAPAATATVSDSSDDEATSLTSSSTSDDDEDGLHTAPNSPNADAEAAANVSLMPPPRCALDPVKVRHVLAFQPTCTSTSPQAHARVINGSLPTCTSGALHRQGAQLPMRNPAR
jgi:hypothetical protein